MNLNAYLQLARVPAPLWLDAQKAIDDAYAATGGTLGRVFWRKHRARWFRAGRIAAALPWGATRLVNVRPDWADDDIEPVRNVTCNGDVLPWDENGPIEHAWLNQDPASDEYKQAVAANYWLPGTHPRSTEARKAWYRRNAGAYMLYMLGRATGELPATWVGEEGKTRVTFLRSGEAWQLFVHRKLWLGWQIETRVGYEISNVFAKKRDGQFVKPWKPGEWVKSWYPLEGRKLMAPVTWSVLPGRTE